MKRIPSMLAVTVLALLGGCASLKTPQVDVHQPPVVQLPQQPPPTELNGSIYQTSTYRPLFEDIRARLVGDVLTIQITENVSASQTSTSDVEKTSALAGGITALPLVSSNSFGKASVGGTGSNVSTGKGANANTNTFTGTITAVVTAVLPNGQLMIAAEKQIGVNQNVDVLRFTGQVDPRYIQLGNTIPSTAVANVRIEQRGRGSAADAMGISWLQRFFLSYSPI